MRTIVSAVTHMYMTSKLPSKLQYIVSYTKGVKTKNNYWFLAISNFANACLFQGVSASVQNYSAVRIALL